MCGFIRGIFDPEENKKTGRERKKEKRMFGSKQIDKAERVLIKFVDIS